VLAAGPDGDNVVRFESRAQFLAAFVVDTARGRNRWYFGEMEGLRVLSAGTRIREVFAREPERARDVLAMIESAGRLDDVIAALSERDARAILEVCGGGHTGPAPMRA